jgi:23S rRNA pseudouridine1911/1915/1917 synthase
MSRVKRIEESDGRVTYRLEVEEEEERLDRFLADALPLTRSQIAGLIGEGRVRVGGEVPKKSYTPEPGDVIVVDVPPPEPTEAEPEPIPVEIVHEDDWLVVVNKPAGMVVHPAPGHSSGTLVNALLHHVERLSSLGGDRRPGIVHRLDKDTSGLLIVAKDETAHRRLSRALSQRAVHRRYLAASWGHLDRDEHVIEAPVGRNPRQRKRMAVVPGGRHAVTHVRRLERWRAADLSSVRLETGRTHQIRVHLHHLGHPVVGDEQYASGWERGFSGPESAWARELARRVTRHFLHATELRFEHPVSGGEMRFEVPLPEELAAVARWARDTS